MEHFRSCDQFSLTALVPDLTSVHPDDAFSSLPYEKGSLLLFYLETLLGGPGTTPAVGLVLLSFCLPVSSLPLCFSVTLLCPSVCMSCLSVALLDSLFYIYILLFPHPLLVQVLWTASLRII